MNIENPATELLNRAQESGIKISSLCREAGINRSTVTKWALMKEPNPKLSTLRKLEEAFEKLQNEFAKK